MWSPGHLYIEMLQVGADAKNNLDDQGIKKLLFEKKELCKVYSENQKSLLQQSFRFLPAT